MAALTVLAKTIRSTAPATPPAPAPSAPSKTATTLLLRAATLTACVGATAMPSAADALAEPVLMVAPEAMNASVNVTMISAENEPPTPA